MRLAAIVLCGGKSTRMGSDKAALPFGGETMLARVVRLLSEVATPIVVVTAAGQHRQELPISCRYAEDARPDRGPLEGLAAGLREIGTDADAVYVTSCDAPLLVAEFVRAVAEKLNATQIAVPWDGKFHHPLAAVYRPAVLSQIEALLAANRLKITDLFDEADTVRIPTEELRAADPQLASLGNLNQPEEYRAALHEAGYTVNNQVGQIPRT